MSDRERERFLADLAAAETSEQRAHADVARGVNPVTRGMLPAGFDPTRDAINPLTGEIHPVDESGHVEHADWLERESWTTPEMIGAARADAEAVHGATWAELIAKRDHARREQSARLRHPRPAASRTRPRRRRSHAGRPGHRRHVATRAGPDDSDPDPAEPADALPTIARAS